MKLQVKLLRKLVLNKPISAIRTVQKEYVKQVNNKKNEK